MPPNSRFRFAAKKCFAPFVKPEQLDSRVFRVWRCRNSDNKLVALSLQRQPREWGCEALFRFTPHSGLSSEILERWLAQCITESHRIPTPGNKRVKVCISCQPKSDANNLAAAKYDLVLKQNMMPKMNCNNHNSKSYAVKRLSNWIEAGWKSWTSLSANRFGFLRAIQRHDSSRKYLQKKIGTVCHEAFDEPNLENMQRYLQKQQSRKPQGTLTWKSILIMWIVLWAMQTLLKVRQICATCSEPMHSFLFECDRWQCAYAWCKHQSSCLSIQLKLSQNSDSK